MKRLNALFLAFILSLSLCSCSNETAQETVSKIAETASEQSQSTDIPPENAKKEENEAEPVNLPKASGELDVHFIDVGQADSALLVCGDETMLIDGGNVADSSVIVTYLKNLGLSHLNYMICTHAHEDHVDLPAEVAAHAAAGHADDKVDECRGEAYGERNARAVHDAHKDVAAELVRAHQMRQARQGVAQRQILPVVGVRREQRHENGQQHHDRQKGEARQRQPVLFKVRPRVLPVGLGRHGNDFVVLFALRQRLEPRGLVSGGVRRLICFHRLPPHFKRTRGSMAAASRSVMSVAAMSSAP